MATIWMAAPASCFTPCKHPKAKSCSIIVLFAALLYTTPCESRRMAILYHAATCLHLHAKLCI
jgi:hypothetical protein